MPSPEVLDISRLIEPISPEAPVGEDLRADSSPTSIYYLVKDARSQARAAERQALMVGEEEAGPADWQPIADTVPDILEQRSKDLEMTAYLIEALVRENGFAGLRDGFLLAKELVEAFGDDIFPLPDEDGIETRVAPLTGLNGEGADGTLIAPILAVSLTDPAAGAYGAAHHREAQELERASEETRERRVSQGAATMDMIHAAVAETSAEYFRNVLDDIEQAAENFNNLTAVLDDKYGHDAPPTSAIKKTLESCREVVETIARDKLATLVVAVGDEAEVEEADGESAGAASGGTGKPKASVGAIENREDAFREILKIAQYFRTNEPHTPISYALEQIVRWGRLPLPDLLKELISDESSVSQMFKLVGIKSGDPSEDQY